MSSTKEPTALFACSKCFTRHPFEELSQGQQLCKKCRGDFPVVKCTYCRSEFQQESKSKTSTICKRCEQNVASYGKPTSCQFCQLPAAFVGGKCQRCSSYYKRYGPPKTCDQCKQKSAFDRGDNSPKLMCWACSCSYKRALAKTKHSDPARHSTVFTKEKKRKSADEERKEKERRKEKYMHSKMPKRPDVTMQQEAPNNPGLTLPPNKAPKRDNGSDMDHLGEINTLKEKIISLDKQISSKNRELIVKDQEITQMKAKVFNEEKLIRGKMQTMARLHDTKVTEMSDKLRSMQAELAKLRKTDNNNSNKRKNNSANLFHDKNKKVAKVASRTASPLSRSRSRSPTTREKPRSRSGSRSRSPTSRNKSRSPSPKGGADSRVGSPALAAVKADHEVKRAEGGEGAEVRESESGGGEGVEDHGNRVKSPDEAAPSAANQNSNSEDSSRSQSRSGSPPSSPMES